MLTFPFSSGQLRAGHLHAERPTDVRQDRDGHARASFGKLWRLAVCAGLRETFSAAGKWYIDDTQWI